MGAKISRVIEIPYIMSIIVTQNDSPLESRFSYVKDNRLHIVIRSKSYCVIFHLFKRSN